MSLAEIVRWLENFLMPAVQAAQAGDRFLHRWTLAGSWEVVARIDPEEGEEP